MVDVDPLAGLLHKVEAIEAAAMQLALDLGALRIEINTELVGGNN